MSRQLEQVLFIKALIGDIFDKANSIGGNVVTTAKGSGNRMQRVQQRLLFTYWPPAA